MGLLAEILLGFIHKNPKDNTDKRSNHIFYKIVASHEAEIYALQCINTSAIFHARITDIVFDIDILHGLHPVQACYIGIEYSNYIKNSKPTTIRKNLQVKKLDKYSMYRYGKYRLLFQNREGFICFINESNKEEFLMDARDIALSEDLIQEFDAAQAFYIGFLAGLKINNPTQKSKPHLRVVR